MLEGPQALRFVEAVGGGLDAAHDPLEEGRARARVVRPVGCAAEAPAGLEDEATADVGREEAEDRHRQRAERDDQRQRADRPADRSPRFRKPRREVAPRAHQQRHEQPHGRRRQRPPGRARRLPRGGVLVGERPVVGAAVAWRHLLRAGPGDDHRDVVGTATDQRQAEERGGRGTRLEPGREEADFLVGDLAGEAVAAEDEDVAGLDPERALEVDVDARMRAHRARDDVARCRAGLHARQSAAGLEIPDERVVTRQLVDRAAPDAVYTAVADMGHEGPARKEDEHRAGGAHPAELGGVLAALVDLAIDLLQRPPQGQGGRMLGGLLVDQRHLARGDRTGQFTGGMGPHPVGDEEQPPARLVLLGVGGGENGPGILVGGAAAADVGQVVTDEARAVSHALSRLGVPSGIGERRDSNPGDPAVAIRLDGRTVRGQSPPWPLSTEATAGNAEGFPGRRRPHPAADHFFPRAANRVRPG